MELIQLDTLIYVIVFTLIGIVVGITFGLVVGTLKSKERVKKEMSDQDGINIINEGE